MKNICTLAYLAVFIQLQPNSVKRKDPTELQAVHRLKPSPGAERDAQRNRAHAALCSGQQRALGSWDWVPEKANSPEWGD